MILKDKVKIIYDVFLGVVLFVVLLCFSVLSVLNCTSIYAQNIEKLNLEEETGLSKEELQKNYNAIIYYNKALVKGELDVPDFDMTEAFREHFRVVKSIFKGIWLCLLTGALILFSNVYWIGKYKRIRFLLWTVVFQNIFLGILIAGCCMGWEWFFTKFHEIVFRNQQWSFDIHQDPLVRLLPEEYFLKCFIIILILYSFFGAICFVIWKLKTKQEQW